MPVSFDVNHRAIALARPRRRRDVPRGSPRAPPSSSPAWTRRTCCSGRSSAPPRPRGHRRTRPDPGDHQARRRRVPRAHRRSHATEVPAVAVEVVDTVGAGDAFVAGYLAELLAGLPAEARLATAVTTGAFACTSPGDWEGYPRRDRARHARPGAGSRHALTTSRARRADVRRPDHPRRFRGDFPSIATYVTCMI